MYEVTKGAHYRHYKGGIYTIENLATHTEDMSCMVVYRDSTGCIWVRPADLFFGVTNEGQRRFVLLDNCARCGFSPVLDESEWCARCRP